MYVEFSRGKYRWTSAKQHETQVGYAHLFPAKNRTPSPSTMVIVWAFPLLERIDIAFFRMRVGIPDRGDSMGGSVISYKVRIVLNWPVSLA